MTHCSKDEFYVKSSNRCCKKCPKGQRVLEDCTENRPTNCVDCSSGEYLESDSYAKRCVACKLCELKSHLETLSACTLTADITCQCQAGFYCNHQVQEQCEHCSPVTKCGPGAGVTKNATRWSNTECKPCPPGTFSNVTDTHSSCQMHTNCTEIGQITRIPGNSSIDTLCSPVPVKPGVPSWVLPGSLWAGFAVSVVVFLIVTAIWKRTNKKADVVHLSAEYLDESLNAILQETHFAEEKLQNSLLDTPLPPSHSDALALCKLETKPDGASYETLMQKGEPARRKKENHSLPQGVSQSLDCLTPVKELTLDWDWVCSSNEEVKKSDSEETSVTPFQYSNKLLTESKTLLWSSQLPMSLISCDGLSPAGENLNPQVYPILTSDPSVTSDVEADGTDATTMTASEQFGTVNHNISIVVSPPPLCTGNSSSDLTKNIIRFPLAEPVPRWKKHIIASSCPSRFGLEPQEDEWTG
ncbi:uncharacterized protein LOC114657947 [Erpetoichthys calabaricus]|uniref:uncharacterized protein LOC114657947 n=1 Tax=Erpetoichthys calabaricus TaxID=27687 RepID=UPI00109FFD7D|nr:uncharacterized protein LOC114657947 [Erpetoichthys calabaricus]